MEHEHVCPKCGKKFKHDDESNIVCPGPGTPWDCNYCYEEKLWGSPSDLK